MSGKGSDDPTSEKPKSDDKEGKEFSSETAEETKPEPSKLSVPEKVKEFSAPPRQDPAATGKKKQESTAEETKAKPSKLSVPEKVKQFSAPPSPDPVATGKKKQEMESVRTLLTLRLNTLSAETQALKDSLAETPPNVKKIAGDLHFLRAQVAETTQQLRKLVDLHIKEKQIEECEALEETFRGYSKCFIMMEIEAKEVLEQQGASTKKGEDDVKPTAPQITPWYHGHHDRYEKDLPKLADNVKEWLPFWALFKEVDEDKTLSSLKKFRRLILATKEGSEAREIVTSYAMSSDNYKDALEHLRTAYGREGVLIKVYARDLIQLAIDRATGKGIEFRKLVNTISAHRRNLELLGVTKTESSHFVYPMIEACLPTHVLQNWQHSSGYADDLEKLMKFLQTEVNNEHERKLAHFNFTEQKEKGNGRAGGKPKEDVGKGGSVPTAVSFHNSDRSQNCLFCEKRHKSADCRIALNMSREEKLEKLQGKRACFACLEMGHVSRTCPNRSKLKCENCGRSHTRNMCSGSPQQNQSYANSPKDDNVVEQHPATQPNEDKKTDGSRKGTTSLFNNMESTTVPLQMLVVTVIGISGKTRKVRAMLDTGSQKSYVTTSLAAEIGFRSVGEETVIHHLFGGGVTPPQTHQKVKLFVAGPNGEQEANFDVSCIPKIAESTALPQTGAWIKEFGKRGVYFHDFRGIPNRIDVLIGNDVAPRLYLGENVDLGTGPVAMKTRWGYVLCGKIPIPKREQSSSASNLSIVTTLANLSITALWDLDLIGIRDEPATQSKEELATMTEEHFKKNVTTTREGRYEVKLPFIAGAIDSLPSNFHAAERRLNSLTDHLSKSELIEKYDSLFRQWEADQMIEEVPIETTSWKEIGHFLPHRAVVKLSSTTTPIRPVFDASAKPKGRPSLNMCMDAGPNYLELIPAILTRFRLRKVGVTADVKKAFQQISIDPEHRRFLQFLWWQNPQKRDKLKVYQHTRVVFGVACSPFLLAATIKHHLDLSPVSHKETAERMLPSLYVDNVVCSLKNIGEALHFKKQSVELLDSAAMDLRGWEAGPTGETRSVPVLGLNWNLETDRLEVDLKSTVEQIGGEATQRRVLAMAHSIFDPLGILSPFILIVKMILRRCHQEKLGWDRALTETLEEDYRKWEHQIPLLKDVTFPRYVYLGESERSSLHVFSDASGDAYAAAVFLRCETGGETHVSLLQSKARLAPKKTTIPRLELIGCYIAARLAATVAEDIGGSSLPTTFYTDSTTALAWICGEGPWAVFVHNRVLEIRRRSSTEQWKHVPGKDNPADLPSRGCSARKLLESRWWNGPNWLSRPQHEWPVMSTPTADEEKVNLEKKKIVAVNLTVTEKQSPLDFLEKISDYPRMVRITSYILRYREQLRERRQQLDPHPLQVEARRAVIPPLTLKEIERGEQEILKHVQKGLNIDELKKLRPFLHPDGIWRTTTRLLYDVEEVSSHPILLPDKNEIVMRLLRNLHLTNHHIGTQLLLAKSRENYWVVNGRRECRKVVTRCWVCRRYNARKLEVPEPPLPHHRTGTGVPFHVIGVDMAGPLIPRKGEKVWVALFTCATYRAIHLEVGDGMSTDEFLVAFRAFVCRRGRPGIVYSDNGLNFVGANAALQQIYQKKIDELASEKGIDWRFNPPSAPWYGGFYERLIGLVKSLLRKILGKRIVTRKELVGLLMEVEEAVNNRPLTYLSESPDDPVPLTPNLMIRNSGLCHFPELDIRDATSARGALKRIQRVREALRSRFRAEYLGALKHQRKSGSFQSLKPGDVVLIEMENEKRIGWPLGVVQEVIGGKDGVPRLYRLRTRFGLVLRAAQRLFPMELAETQGCTEGSVQRENEGRTAHVNGETELLSPQPSSCMMSRGTSFPGA